MTLGSRQGLLFTESLHPGLLTLGDEPSPNVNRPWETRHSNLEFRLQSSAYTVEDALGNPTGEQLDDLCGRRQFAFPVKERILDFTQQIFRQIQRLLQ